MKSAMPCLLGVFFLSLFPSARAQTLYVPSGTVGGSSNENVGVGTDSPNAKLEIQPSGGSVGLRLKNITAATNWDFYAYSDGNFYLNNGNGSVVNIFANASANLLYLRGGSVGIGTLNTFRPLNVEAGDASPINQGIVINSSHAFGVGAGTAASALVFARNRAADTSSLNTSAQIAGGNESETTSNNGFLSFHTCDEIGNVVERMRINSAGNVGIGTANPSGALHIYRSGQADLRLQTENRQWALLSNVAWGANGFSIYDVSADSARLHIDVQGNIGIGTITPQSKLAVNGTITAKEVIVTTTGWSDYVFEDDYRLSSLSSVEQHIKAEKHLPGIPSATEVTEKGISLGDMQAKLLEKIEELTLHQIAQEKELAVMKSQNAELRARLEKLER